MRLLVSLALLCIASPDPAEHSRSIPLVLEPDGGRASAQTSIAIEFDGVVRIWATSESGAEVGLRVADRGSDPPARAGAGGAAWIEVEVEAGRVLEVRVLARDPGDAELVVRALPRSTEQALAAERIGAELDDIASESDPVAALAGWLDELDAVDAGAPCAETVALRRRIASACETRSELALASRACGAIATSARETLPPDHPERFDALRHDASLRLDLGDWSGARPALEELARTRERALGPDAPEVLEMRTRVAAVVKLTGDMDTALTMLAEIEGRWAATVASDDARLLAARGQLCLASFQAGRFDEAGERLEEALAAVEGALPDTHADVLWLRNILVLVRRDQGRIAEALELAEALLGDQAAIWPEGHPELLTTRSSIGLLLRELGRTVEAKEVFVANVDGWRSARPPDHPDVLDARLNLAHTLDALGDAAGARAIAEDLRPIFDRRYPPGHPRKVELERTLARTMLAGGDARAARALLEDVVTAFAEQYPPGHPRLLGAQSALAEALREAGDLDGAGRMYARILEALDGVRGDDDPEVVLIRHELGTTLFTAGRSAEAREIFRDVLEASERLYPEGAPRLALARGSMALAMVELGELEAAARLQEGALGDLERALGDDHPHVLAARADLGATAWRLGDLDRARAVLEDLEAGLRSRSLATSMLAPREAREVVWAGEHRRWIGLLLSFSATQPDAEADRGMFELLELLREVSLGAARTLRSAARDPELLPLLDEASRVRTRLADLLLGGEGGATGSEATRIALERDRLQGEIRSRIGGPELRFDGHEVAASLPKSSAAASFARYARWERDAGSGALTVGPDHLVAHVLDRAGTVTRVELGPAGVIESRIEAWRDSIGSSASARGVRIGGQDPGDEERLGSALYRDLLAPVLAAAGPDVERLYVSLEGALYSLPLDALIGPGGRVGDTLRIVDVVSIATLGAAPPSIPDDEERLLVVGDVDYGADVEAGGSPSWVVAATRSSTTSFSPLPGTGEEIEAIAELYLDVFGDEPTVLRGPAASRASLRDRAAGARYLHLATHGYFAAAGIPSRAETDDERDPSLRERVLGFAPMTLCGLALAGANRGHDGSGRARGILTAEEIATLDLDTCELAVLSACETNVGVRRAGQGIQSMQTALFAAGARSSITSLWEVDDASTRELMDAFYESLWVDGRSKADALWRAKKALREAGRPVRDWAGWVLSGSAD